MKFTKYSIYVGLHDKDNRTCNYDMVTYEALFNRFMREDMVNFFDSSTVYNTAGHWKGTAEPSRVIEILWNEDEPAIFNTISDLAQALKDLLNQEAVLITQETVHGDLI